MLSQYTSRGHRPNTPFLQVPAAPSFSEAQATGVASESSTVQPSSGRLSTVIHGNPSGRSRSSPHTRRRTAARARAIRRRCSSPVSSRVRHTVGAEAVGPRTARWCSNNAMSPIASAPRTIAQARSTSTRPRGCSGQNPGRRIAPVSASSSPVFSASSCRTTPPT